MTFNPAGAMSMAPGTSSGGALGHTLYLPYTTMGVFTVSAGTHTFYALARGASPCCNTGDASVQSNGITAVFVPENYSLP
jgi:hypothetical protein